MQIGKLWYAVPGVAAGVVAGIAAARLAAREPERPMQSSAAVSSPARPVRPSVQSELTLRTPRFDPIRPDPTDAAERDPDAALNLERSPNDDRRNPPSAEQIQADLTQKTQARLEAHAREWRDPAWATGTEQAIRDGLAEAADAGGTQLVSVECKTTSCVVTMHWPTYADARMRYHSVADTNFGRACGTWIYLPPPERPDDPYEGKLILDCTESRVVGK
jgi:hypothetical protein